MNDMVNCIWMEDPLSADNRSRYATNTLLNLMLDKAEVGFVHRNGWKEKPADCTGAVVVIQGANQAPIVSELSERVATLDWALTIVTGDELRRFPSKTFCGPQRRVWVQYPAPGLHDHASHYLVAGYPTECPAHLEHLAEEMERKPLDWSFAGQVNNHSRRVCVAELKRIGHGFLYVSPGFWQGLPKEEYYRLVAQSKIVACPAGAAVPESLRVFEALEAGCVPVVDDRGPTGVPGYWKLALGEDPPFPVLSDWTEFPTILERELREWPKTQIKLKAWFQAYKQRMCDWLVEDLRAIGGIS